MIKTSIFAAISTFSIATAAFAAPVDPTVGTFGDLANVGSNDVTVIDPETADIVARLPVGDRPYGVAFANDRAFVTNQYEDTVSVFAMDTLDPLGKRPTGEYPEGIDSSSDGKNIIVANWFDNTVTVIDAATLSMLNEIETCDGPRAFGEFVMGDEE